MPVIRPLTLLNLLCLKKKSSHTLPTYTHQTVNIFATEHVYSMPPLCLVFVCVLGACVWTLGVG